MSNALKWIAGLSAALAVTSAMVGGCSSKTDALSGDGDDGGGGGGGGQSSSSGSGSEGFGSSSGFSSGASTTTTTDVNNGPCKGGHYGGTFAGSYTSHLTGVGIPIPVTGNVELTLDQEGTADMTCHSGGEIPVPCNDVFSLDNGTITGIADGAVIGDATIGGFPYYCTMTGSLDCPNKKLDDGWIQCTYCIGPLADGGMACSLLNGVGGTTGVGGHFAGPLTANYDYGTLSFIMGAWNGAEALAGNDGGSPGPEGGPIADYLSDGGLYLGPNDFGGIGTWNATYGKP
jgi:hypothetical protein